MRARITCSLVLLTASTLLLGCSSKSSVLPVPTTARPAATLPDVTLPAGVTIPDVSLPSGASIPDIQNIDAVITQILDQMEASGVPLDRACMEKLLKDTALLQQVQASGELSPEIIQQFMSCLKSG